MKKGFPNVFRSQSHDHRLGAIEHEYGGMSDNPQGSGSVLILPDTICLRGVFKLSSTSKWGGSCHLGIGLGARFRPFHARISPLALTTTSLNGISTPALARAFFTMIGSAEQQGTSITTEVMLLIPDT